MAETRLHLINLHTSGTTAPTESADLRLGEIAVQHNNNDPALYIKKDDNTYAKFVPNIDISGETSGSGNVITGIAVANNKVTATKGNVVDSATGDTLISATVSGGTKVVVSATTVLSQAVAEAHTHGNIDVLDNITSGKVANWDEAYTNTHTHSNKALLDTYTQTEANLADAVAKKHEHTNKEVLDDITSGKVESWDEAAENTHTHNNKSVLDGITSEKVSNWDDAYDYRVTGATGDSFVSASVANNKVTVGATTAATSAATASNNGLATAYETKQYIDSKTTNIKNVTTIDGKAISSSADTFAIETGNSLLTKSTGQSGAAITTTLGLVTGATSSNTEGLAVNTDVKDYVDNASITGDGFVIGASGLNVSHKAYSVTNTPKTASPAHGGTFVAISDIKYDGHGHVSAATATTVTLPSETHLSKGDATGSGNVVTDLSVNDHEITLTKGITALTAVTATGDNYVDASVASNSTITVGLKSVADSKEDIAGASATGSVADAKAVKDYVDAQVTSSVNYCGATSTIPTAIEAGDLYIASGQIAIPTGSSATGAATTAETGDYLISRSAGKWDVIEKNLTGAVTSSADLAANALVVGNGNQTVKKASQVGDATHPIYINASGVPVASTNAIQVVSAADGSNALAWNSAVTLATITIDGTATTIDAKLPVNPATAYTADEGIKLEGTVFKHRNILDEATVDILFEKHSYDFNGHITGSEAVTKSDITNLGIPAQDTTYTFASGASGSFTVTPAGGTAQTVSIGKPASAGTADNAVHASAATKVDSALTITYADGTAAKTYDGSAAVSIEIPAVTAVTVTDGTNALDWNTDKTLATINVGGTDYVINAKLPENPNTDYSGTTEALHYAPATAASTAGTANSFIRQITLDSKKHVISVVTGTPEPVSVVNCGATITTASTTLATVAGSAITASVAVSSTGATVPVNSANATTLATVAGANVTAKVSMESLTIAGANSKADGETFDGKTDIEITVLDCGEY